MSGKASRSRSMNTQYFRDYRKKFPVLCKLQNIRTNAQGRGIPFLITKAEYFEWHKRTPEQCVYCDVVDLSIAGHGPMGQLRLFTIDRKDNALPYTIENICKACWFCNRLKNDFFSFDEWREIALKYVKPKWMARLQAALDKAA